MRLTSEITIDIDANRRIWLQASADDVGEDDVPKVSSALAEAVSKQGLGTWETVSRAVGIKPPGPDMRTFGED